MDKNSAFQVIQFPGMDKSAPVKRRKVRKSVDKIKYFNASQIKLLRRAAREQAEMDIQKNRVTAIRDWMVIDLLTSTGLRVSEASNLRCGDLKIGYAESKVYVREGKGGISGHIVINESLKKHLKHYLKWKQDQGEGIEEDDFFFMGQRGPWTAQAIQLVVKKYLRDLKMYEPGKSVHALRHSYAVQLYSKERDLRTVQKQLRHVSIQSTLVYADVTDETISEQIKGLWQ